MPLFLTAVVALDLISRFYGHYIASSSREASPVPATSDLVNFEAQKLTHTDNWAQNELKLMSDDNSSILEFSEYFDSMDDYDLEDTPFFNLKFQDFYHKLQKFSRDNPNLTQQEITKLAPDHYAMNTTGFPGAHINDSITFVLHLDKNTRKDLESLDTPRFPEDMDDMQVSASDRSEIKRHQRLGKRLLKIIVDDEDDEDDEYTEEPETEEEDYGLTGMVKSFLGLDGDDDEGFYTNSWPRRRQSLRNRRVRSRYNRNRRRKHIGRRRSGSFRRRRPSPIDRQGAGVLVTPVQTSASGPGFFSPGPGSSVMDTFFFRVMPTFLTLGGLLGFGMTSFLIDNESNNFDFSPNITYQGDNQVFNQTDIDTFTNTQTQSSSNSNTNTQTNTNTNTQTNTVVPVIVNADGTITIGPITGNGNGRRKKRDSDKSTPILDSPPEPAVAFSGPTVSLFFNRGVPLWARKKLQESLGDILNLPQYY